MVCVFSEDRHCAYGIDDPFSLERQKVVERELGTGFGIAARLDESGGESVAVDQLDPVPPRQVNGRPTELSGGNEDRSIGAVVSSRHPDEELDLARSHFPRGVVPLALDDHRAALFVFSNDVCGKLTGAADAADLLEPEIAEEIRDG
jgi:hypothetical protein